MSDIIYPVFRGTDGDGEPTGSVLGADNNEICESLVTADDIGYARRIAAALNATRHLTVEQLEAVAPDVMEVAVRFMVENSEEE